MLLGKDEITRRRAGSAVGGWTGIGVTIDCCPLCVIHARQIAVKHRKETSISTNKYRFLGGGMFPSKAPEGENKMLLLRGC